MKKSILACLLSITSLLSLTANAAEPLVRFEDGIGVQPLRATPTPTLNVVRGVNPGGFPWVISRLSADVSTDGSIRVDGRGLLVAGSDSIATPAGQSVRARLFCESAAHDSDLVPLDTQGDFKITGFLNPIPPSPCTHPALLILNGGGVWFAAGIPKQ